jgi:hypothetical protein
MKNTLVMLLAVVLFACAAAIGTRGGAQAGSMAATAPAAGPATGFALHIDAIRHFPKHLDEVAHHWCKSVAGMLECQIYDGDGPQAHMVAAEVVVPTSVWKTFPADEQKLWHYHKVEIPKVHITFPGMSQAQAATVTASMIETYGKVYQIWDPMSSKYPMGQPQVNILH